MVIKGIVAKRDGERLHPVADVEQEKKERIKEKIGCAVARTGTKKKEEAEEKG